MSRFKSSKLVVITLVYWVLLVYVVAALVWWFISLNKQNERMALLLVNELQHDDPAYVVKTEKILDGRQRKTTQYLGEGVTFLALIMVGAVFVYRAARRQIKLSQQQQNFMMAVTHELKTPIAVTQLNLETLQKRKLEEPQRQKLISNTLQEANRLNTLCNNILLASQLDAGAYKVSMSELDMSSLVQSIVNEYKDRFPNRNIAHQITPEIDLVGEQLLLQMLMNNLLDNALKYTPKDKLITVTLTKNHNQVLLSVTDQGPGIPKEERLKIFEKFYRIGNESTRTAKGSGLGLFLCKKIADDHNADIKVTDNHLQGSIFTVEFKS
ncbi:MAG: HAMP domain-containing histidine kinase [Chitinophagaceae bacterium]|nr:HAMP domain-containing histidine kinase [Chitinophagaceae bacterium]